MTTLADMTEEEREQCRGMWVAYQTPMGEHQAIYEDDNVLFEPGYGLFTVPLHHITPSPSLPRAWTPDGTPPAGKWEYMPEVQNPWGAWKIIAGPTADKAEAESWTATEQFKDTTTRVMKRFIGEWETA